MAKKKQELSSEELLAEALVREEDWPYEVPGNWVWVRLGSVAEYIQRGKSPKYSDIEQYPVISQKCIQWSGFDPSIVRFINPDSISIYGEERFIQNGDILWNSTGTGTIGRLNIYNDELKKYKNVVADSHVTVVRIRNLCKKYIYFYLTSPRIQGEIEKRATGTTNQIELNTSTIVNQFIPLPPLAEQQRIVDRIESLFDQLDHAKELIQEALDSFETRKAAILHQAFTGQLTKKWRAAHGVGMESWSIRPLSELCTSFQYGTSKKSLASGKVVVIRMGNLQQGEIRWDNLAYTDDDEDINKYLLKNGDILFNRTNSPELVGKTSVYRGEFPAIFAGYLIRLKNNDMLNSYYLNYMMNSQRAKIYCNSVKTDGVNQSNINAKKIAAFEIPHCSVPEQLEIVRILDDLFAKEQNAKDLCDLIDQIEAIKKTMLGQAFRGELGTNEAEDESASSVLRKVLSCE